MANLHKGNKPISSKRDFEVLNNLLEALVKDDYIIGENKTFVEGLLKESKEREAIYTGKK